MTSRSEGEGVNNIVTKCDVQGQEKHKYSCRYICGKARFYSVFSDAHNDIVTLSVCLSVCLPVTPVIHA